MDDRKTFKSNQEVCVAQPIEARPSTVRDTLDRLLFLQTGAIDHLKDMQYAVEGQQIMPDTDIKVDAFCLNDLVASLIRRQEIINDVLFAIKCKI